MARYKLTIAYDGTNFSGWQVQQNSSAIQPLIQKALEVVLRHKLDLTGSGRTDAGVHARGQTAHFDSETSFDPPKLLLSLNALLPKDIRILSVERVAADFHARYSARSKIYHYHLHLFPIADPFFAPYRFQVLDRIEIEALRQAAPLFLGTRDFTSFANEAKRGSASKNPVRTLLRFDIVEEFNGVRLELEGDGFLYKMVRNLAGALLDVARGKISPSQVGQIFAAKDRRQVGAALPAHALFLHQVNYY
ncbi:MAG TPA: tRNA pseudouridine(38-40) synthase TruA [Chlamydiales bacterium]|jgi:tRNA pseudouridine38-40 synthase|nr:tRNA pseudouridine(38-40) synthase TruA [Chlamydiales bacterium]